MAFFISVVKRRPLVVLGLFLSFQALASVDNRKELQKLYDLNPEAKLQALAKLKIAVLDNGFGGVLFEKSVKKHLAPNTVFAPYPQNQPANTKHGLEMAQIVWALSGQLDQSPEIHLVNTNGFTNFEAAIDYVVAQKIDIVLYSQNWEFGSNFDGSGLINATIQKALDAGVLWINSAGNFGKVSYQQFVSLNQKSQIFSNKENALAFLSKFDDNSIKITLSWNDFSNFKDDCSLKNLDLLIFDQKGALVSKSDLKQGSDRNDDNFSCYARESINLNGLAKGQYFAKVQMQSSNFLATDQFRIVFNAQKEIELPLATNHSEAFSPADHSDVLSIGFNHPDSSKIFSPYHLTLPFTAIEFSTGDFRRDSSGAAAIFAAVSLNLRANGWTNDDIKSYITRIPRSSDNLLYLPEDMRPPMQFANLLGNGEFYWDSERKRIVFLSLGDPFEIEALQGASQKVAPADREKYRLYVDRSGQWHILKESTPAQLSWIELRQQIKGGLRYWTNP